MEKIIPVDVEQEPRALLLSGVQSDEQVFFQQFVAQHGGAFCALEQPACYRLDLPNGTQRGPNDAADPLMQSTYRLRYPDGASLIWFRTLTIDGVPHADILLTPVEDVEWPLGEHEPYQLAG